MVRSRTNQQQQDLKQDENKKHFYDFFCSLLFSVFFRCPLRGCRCWCGGRCRSRCLLTAVPTAACTCSLGELANTPGFLTIKYLQLDHKGLHPTMSLGFRGYLRRVPSKGFAQKRVFMTCAKSQHEPMVDYNARVEPMTRSQYEKPERHHSKH